MEFFSLGFPEELFIWKLQELPQNALPKGIALLEFHHVN